jgi:hypothetical protein
MPSPTGELHLAFRDLPIGLVRFAAERLPFADALAPQGVA